MGLTLASESGSKFEGLWLWQPFLDLKKSFRLFDYAIFLPQRRAKAFELVIVSGLDSNLVYLNVQAVETVVEPVADFVSLLLRRVQLCAGCEAFFGVGFRLRLPLHDLEPLHLLERVRTGSQVDAALGDIVSTMVRLKVGRL